MKVLIVEDDFLISLAFSQMIADLGHELAAKLRNAEDALDYLERNRPDLIFMDVRLDGPMDGLEAAAIIRERWGIPLAFISAFRDQKTLRQAESLSPVAFLDKPVSLESLKALLDAEGGRAPP
jgi:CheY-like chemotaxis protein